GRQLVLGGDRGHLDLGRRVTVAQPDDVPQQLLRVHLQVRLVVPSVRLLQGARSERAPDAQTGQTEEYADPPHARYPRPHAETARPRRISYRPGRQAGWSDSA